MADFNHQVSLKEEGDNGDDGVYQGRREEQERVDKGKLSIAEGRSEGQDDRGDGDHAD